MRGLYIAAAERLADRCPSLQRVETGMSMKAVEVFALTAGAVTALVIPLNDAAAPLREAGLIVSQEEVWRFGVVLTLAYPGGFPQYEPARDEIKAALRGWSPAGASMPVAYVGGRTLVYDVADRGGEWRTLFEFSVPTQATYEHQA